MSPSSSSLWTKTVALGVIVVATVVGNVSLSAAGPTPAVETTSGFGFSKFDYSATGVERDSLPSLPADLPDIVPSAELGQVVPAIYAWDPDVRFVFYRHVSKWM